LTFAFISGVLLAGAVEGVVFGVCAGRVAGVCAGAWTPLLRVAAGFVVEVGAGAGFGFGDGAVCALATTMKSMLMAKRKMDFFMVISVSYMY
jgi:hypothetical protein